jgi:hypothetical protein
MIGTEEVENEEEQRSCNAMSQIRRALLYYERDLEGTEGSRKLSYIAAGTE